MWLWVRGRCGVEVQVRDGAVVGGLLVLAVLVVLVVWRLPELHIASEVNGAGKGDYM